MGMEVTDTDLVITDDLNWTGVYQNASDFKDVVIDYALLQQGFTRDAGVFLTAMSGGRSYEVSIWVDRAIPGSGQSDQIVVTMCADDDEFQYPNEDIVREIYHIALDVYEGACDKSFPSAIIWPINEDEYQSLYAED